MSGVATRERPEVEARAEGVERRWIVLDPPVRYRMQHEMRFGRRSHTAAQGATIIRAVATRTELPEPALPLED